jgi:glutamyl-tRNA synthetase
MDEEEIRRILWISGLKNAIEFGGIPNRKAVMGKLMADRKDLRLQAKIINPILDDIIGKIKDLDIEKQKEKLLNLDPNALEKKESLAEEKQLPPLPDVKHYKKVVMRLAPYPSGALHIGNARMIVLNDEYTKRYNGDLILFFDDTIGSPKSLRNNPKAKFVLLEAYDLIKEGIEWLDVKYSKVLYKSDRLETFYEYCEKLIEDHIAYVCFCPANEFREKFKKLGNNCPHRDQTVEKNLIEWKSMLEGKYQEGKAVVRIKTGMDQKDPALRDQIIMRLSEAEHPRVGTKYLVWPMLEFSWAIDDYLIGVTHILRGSDLIKEDFIEDFIWDHFGWSKAEFLHYGRLNFSDLSDTEENLLSKTNARNNIQNGKYEFGWEDPRTWSLQSLMKRGINPKALKASLLDLGLSINAINFSVNWLYSKNRDIIDEISDRYFFVENPILLKIKNIPSNKYIAEPLVHPSHPEKGHRKINCVGKNNQLEILISISDTEEMESGQIIRLKDLMNIRVESINFDEKVIESTFHSKDLSREFSIIQWVPKDEKVKVSILNPDGSLSEGFGEINLLKIPMNRTIQFERYGFVNPIELKENSLFCYFTH